MSYSKPVLYITALSTLALFATALVPALQEMQMPKATDEHKHLIAGAGEWEGTLTSYYDESGKVTATPTPPMHAKETVTAIGDFWLLSEFQCDMPGMPYQGSGHIGYNADKKKYIGTWVDNMSSHFALMEGELDPKTKMMVMRWQGPDMTGKLVPHRHECVEGGDTRTMTFYMGEGAGTKTMVIEMKRKKGKAAEAGATK